MSHELRTPLNAILGFSSLLRREAALTSAQYDKLDIINRSGEHLLTLINNVLEMSRIESGRVQLETVPLDLGKLVHDVVDMMRVRAQEKGVELLIEQLYSFPYFINGDEARLRQILINLVGNALKFTEQGNVTVRMDIKARGSRPDLLIAVQDTGCGIALEDQKRIFEPFVQVGEHSINQGSGLGLAITRQFIQMMGGSITLDSTQDKGSRFQITLPLIEFKEMDASPLASEQFKGEIIGLAPGQPEYRLLIVEDQLENQQLLKQLMENIGFNVKVVENGQQSVDLFQSWQPHLIWMDRRMPVMDGIAATKIIRKLPGGKAVKIVAVTASALAEQREKILNAGMDDFISKPYRSNEIYQCLSKQLGVQYIYADNLPLTDSVATPLTAQMLATVLPAELRDELRDALISLDEEWINTLIQQIATYDTDLQSRLSRLANNYNYPAILQLLEINPTRKES